MAPPRPTVVSTNQTAVGVSDTTTSQQGAPELVTSEESQLKPKNERVSYMSLPSKGQLAILCLARMVDPLAATSIQSYLFYQLKFFDPSASSAAISTQAGLIVGAKTAAQVCTGMLWGRLADSTWAGRRTVLICGLLCSGIACFGYGFSRSFSSAVAWTIFGGATNSNVAIIRCVVAELNPEKRYRTRALLLLPLSTNAGMLLGPLIGGLLSSQNGHGLLEPFPYAPPNILIASLYALATLGVFFGLKETLEGLQHNQSSLGQRMWKALKACFVRDQQYEHAYTAVGSEEPITPTTPVLELVDSPRPSGSTPEAPKVKARLPFRRIWTFNVLCTLLAHFIIAGHLGTFTSLWAIFLSTPVGAPADIHLPFGFNGGLGMQPRDIGFAMSLLGTVGIILQAAVYPMLNDRYGTIKIWRAALFVFPIVYLVAPFPSLVASAISVDTSKVFVWLAMSFVLLLFVLGKTGVTPATTLLINDCTPHPSVRGTIHTAGSVIGNLSRSIFPPTALALFGKGLQVGVVGLGFWCLAGLAILACVASRWVKEGSNGEEIKLEEDEEQNDLSDRRTR